MGQMYQMFAVYSISWNMICNIYRNSGQKILANVCL